MSPEPSRTQAPKPDELLSELLDGECGDAAAACACWCDDASARATWHAYLLIGDVLRSEDLALRPDRDAQLLAGVRGRLAREPVPLMQPVPAAPLAPVRRRLGWHAPAAVAAGFAAVTGMLVLTHGAPDSAPAAPPPALAAASAAQAVPPAQGVLEAAAEPGWDPQLDAYLRAHQWARGGAIGSPPGVMLRNIDMAAPVRPAAMPMTAVPGVPR